MLRYAITSRALFRGEEAQKQSALVAQCARWATEGVDFIQLREKDLSPGALAVLARSILQAIAQSTRSEIDPEAAKIQGPKARSIPAWGEAPGTEQREHERAESPTHSSPGTKLLINSRVDVAVATGAQGVHLTAAPSELTPTQIRQIYAAANHPEPIITISCHTIEEVRRAVPHKPDAILFAPVFGKTVAGEAITPAAGLGKLREACTAASPIPVYALGGVTQENAPSCIEAGARGIAGIRLFLG